MSINLKYLIHPIFNSDKYAILYKNELYLIYPNFIKIQSLDNKNLEDYLNKYSKDSESKDKELELEYFSQNIDFSNLKIKIEKKHHKILDFIDNYFKQKESVNPESVKKFLLK